ncbi:MAG: hypothetical protein GH155_02145 [Spirochaeta sp.]|nr:hypothetical protein [Spirochaeta sp.]
MKSITIRGIDNRLQTELEKMAAKNEKSINKTILFLLKKALGIEDKIRFPTYNDLDHLAGTWSEQDEREFSLATEQFNKIDQDSWK